PVSGKAPVVLRRAPDFRPATRRRGFARCAEVSARLGGTAYLAPRQFPLIFIGVFHGPVQTTDIRRRGGRRRGPPFRCLVRGGDPDRAGRRRPRAARPRRALLGGRRPP